MASSTPVTDPALHHARFVALVERFTADRLARRPRKHTCCVANAVGPSALARMFRPERLPHDAAELEAFAARLTDWALGLAPSDARPYDDDDLVSASR